ncbi:hypothetical protein LCGC14_0744710 [marine sediment metagenome]|uniref:Uncharacterized protein n=1 Tax=marine sediment metagenome TaxID=412755 RepID=A0A0F9Q9Z5_9ZZZZ
MRLTGKDFFYLYWIRFEYFNCITYPRKTNVFYPLVYIISQIEPFNVKNMIAKRNYYKSIGTLFILEKDRTYCVKSFL